MFCQECGKENDNSCNYCGYCGAKLQINKSYSTSLAEKAFRFRVLNKYEINLCGMIASLLILLSTFLPFISANILGTKISQNLVKMEGYQVFGIIVLLLAITGVITSFFGKDTIVAISGVLSTGIFAVIYIVMEQEYASDEVWGELAKMLVQKEVGYIFLVIGSILLLISGIVGIILKRKNI